MDLKLSWNISAQQWRDVVVVDLGEHCSRGAIQGKRPKTATDAELVLYVVPCSLAESISMAWYVSIPSLNRNIQHFPIG